MLDVSYCIFTYWSGISLRALKKFTVRACRVTDLRLFLPSSICQTDGEQRPNEPSPTNREGCITGPGVKGSAPEDQHMKFSTWQLDIVMMMVGGGVSERLWCECIQSQTRLLSPSWDKRVLDYDLHSIPAGDSSQRQVWVKHKIKYPTFVPT